MSRLLAPTDTLARGEGDEFILVMASDELEAVTRYVRPIQDALGQPLAIDGGRELVVCASLGMAVFPRDGDCAEDLLRNAATAMLKAKREGGEGFRFYAPAMNASVLARLELEHALRRAIQQNGLVLHYQPQIEARTGRIIGAEALVRWPHPDQGMLAPGDFIPLAEDAALIAPLGEWVLREACRQNRAWQEAGLPPLVVAVNLSARQLAVTDIAAMTAKVLQETGLDPLYLELELTESAALGDIDACVEASQRLRALSVSLALDDFGTGFSSLSYLRRFAIDRLKIDRSFVCDLPEDPGSAGIVTAIIGLAHSLHMVALAEGVETADQVELLAAQGCDEMQGYYFSRPVSADALAALLRARPFEHPGAGDGG
jgi:EAL domain-containing protein (putative c-di-GMP-specific phosphodiesterase class I)